MPLQGCLAKFIHSFNIYVNTVPCSYLKLKYSTISIKSVLVTTKVTWQQEFWAVLLDTTNLNDLNNHSATMPNAVGDYIITLTVLGNHTQAGNIISVIFNNT